VVEQRHRRARPGGTAAGGPRCRLMTRTYVQVMIVQAAVIVALWLLGRAFS